MKKLSKIFAVVLCLALALSVLPMAFAAECHLVDGKAYKIVANNANGPLYFKGTITDGRFDCSANEAEAVAVYAQNVAGGWKLYIMNGTAKQYIVMGDSSTGGAFADTATDATLFEWNSDLNTLVVAEDSNNRAFGCGATSTFTNFCGYDVSNSYNWGQFVVYAAVEDTRADLPTAAADIVNAIYALTAGESLSDHYKFDSFTLTGTVVGESTWSDNYSNGEVTIKVAGTDKEILAWRFGAGEIDLQVVKALAEGDKVTFTAESAKNYNGTYEMEYPVLTAVEKAGSNNNNDNNNDNDNNNNNNDVEPDAGGDNTAIFGMSVIMVVAVVAMAVLVIGKKKLF